MGRWRAMLFATTLLTTAACEERQGRGASTGQLAASLAVEHDSILRRTVHAVPVDSSGTVTPLFEARLGAADTLVAIRWLPDTTSLARVVDMEVVDELLLVADRQTSPHLFAFHLPTGRLVSATGRQGRGPGEFIDPTWLMRRTGRELWVYDFATRRATLLDFADPVRPRVRAERTLNLGLSLRSVVFGDSLLVANGLFADFTLLVMDTLGQPIRRVAGRPPFGPADGLSPVGQRLTNVNMLQVSPDRRRLVVAYQFAPRLDIYSNDGTLQTSVLGPRPTRASFRTDPRTGRFHWNDDNESAYVDVETTASHIYALFQGRRDLIDPQPLPDRVHVFTWTGQFVRELVLEPPTLRIAISGDGTRLFGFVEDPHPQVAEWRLPPWGSHHSSSSHPGPGR